MINRDDMLELTRRMTPARASVGRIAGAYFDEEGYVDGTFNTNFLKLSASERTRNLNMAKTVLIAKTNEQLKEYRITTDMNKPPQSLPSTPYPFPLPAHHTDRST